MINEALKESILKLQMRYPCRRSALIPALHMVQAEIGYLPLEVQAQVAELFDLPTSEVSTVVTFYDLFSENPTGQHHIHFCKNLPCMLQGSDALLEKICHKLQVQPGDTTADGEFTVHASECLGACDRAPMMILDEEVFGPLQENELDDLLERAKNTPKHASIFKEPSS